MITNGNISSLSEYKSPFTKPQMEHGLEWISGKVRITVKYEGNYIDIVVYPNYPIDDHISLFLNVASVNNVRVTDLIGNGSGTKYQNHGYGTLIFNIGIQAIYAYFDVAQADIAARTIDVSGYVSSSGDPGCEPSKSQCRDRRNAFWSSFGFCLNDEKAFDTTMKATLADLRIKVDGLTVSGTPRCVALEDFWLQGDAPVLFRSDLNVLMATNLEDYNIGELLSEAKIEKMYMLRFNIFKTFHRFFWVSLSAAWIYFACSPLSNLNALSLSLAGIFISYIVSIPLSERIWWLLPVLRKHDTMIRRRNKAVSGLKQSIMELEESHNGLLWRLHQGLKCFDESMAQKVFDELADNSKRQYSFRLSDRYLDYQRFMAVAKHIVITQGLKYDLCK